MVAVSAQQSQPRRRFSYCLCWCILSLSLFWACGIDPITPTDCKKNVDCAGTQLCIKGKCQQNWTDASTERLPEPPADQGSDAEKPDQSTETAPEQDAGDQTDQAPPEVPSTACKDGDTRPCYSGEPETKGKGPCQGGQQSCIGGFWDAECVGETVPSEEICNGKDDDCNGKVDEADPNLDAPCSIAGAKGPCASGKQVCTNGSLVCQSSFKKQPEEICNNRIDDDCDGLPDGPPCKCRDTEKRECSDASNTLQGLCQAGTQECKDSKWGPCVGEVKPKPELCDGKDNDCDGQIDESFPERNEKCTDSSSKGQCQQGKRTCSDGKLSCTSIVAPSKEICDGKDNDCNGKADEGCQCKPSSKANCYSGASGTLRAPCRKGSKTCDSQGKWGPCVGEVTPKPEVCDNKDNDCDGKIDDKITRSCKSQCGSGVESCNAGKWGRCSAAQPTSERCNGKDDNCNGKTDESLTQSCSNGCGPGSEICQNGRWVNCTAPKAVAEICDNKDNDCDGKIDENPPCACRHTSAQSCYTGPKGQDKAPCKRGTQTCDRGKWGACIGQILPSKEICDGKDNDCDGKIDNGVNCQCTSGSIRACYTARTGCTKSGSSYRCITPCKAGTQKCSSGKWGACSGQALPQGEVCDGKDNDCDGKVDESDPFNGRSCTTSKLGLCRIGKYVCSSGRRTCRQTVFPVGEVCDGKDNNCNGKTDETDIRIGKSCTISVLKGVCRNGKNICSGGKLICKTVIFPTTERCRNLRDDDCDGKTDEICGPLYSYAQVSSTGKLSKGRYLKSRRISTGTYGIKSLSSIYDCNRYPLLVTVDTSLMRPTSIYCRSGEFEVRTGSSQTTTGALSDRQFHAVQPRSTNSVAWGLVSPYNCITSTKTACSITRSYSRYSGKSATLKVTRISTGYYEIHHPACSYIYQPYFVNIYSSKVSGYAVAYGVYSGKCRVRTYDLNAKAKDYPFYFWLPDRNATAWAYVSSSGGVITSNYFGDSRARWKSKIVKDSKGAYYYHDVTFPSWISPSAVLANARATGTYYAVFTPSTSGARVYTYGFSSKTRRAYYFYVLFAQ